MRARENHEPRRRQPVPDLYKPAGVLPLSTWPALMELSGTVRRVRLLSWNVAGRADKLPAQLDAVLGRAPDVVALQEISRQTYPAWREGLFQAGYSLVSSADLA